MPVEVQLVMLSVQLFREGRHFQKGKSTALLLPLKINLLSSDACNGQTRMRSHKHKLVSPNQVFLANECVKYVESHVEHYGCLR